MRRREFCLSAAIGGFLSAVGLKRAKASSDYRVAANVLPVDQTGQVDEVQTVNVAPGRIVRLAVEMGVGQVAYFEAMIASVEFNSRVSETEFDGLHALIPQPEVYMKFLCKTRELGR